MAKTICWKLRWKKTVLHVFSLLSSNTLYDRKMKYELLDQWKCEHLIVHIWCGCLFIYVEMELHKFMTYSAEREKKKRRKHHHHHRNNNLWTVQCNGQRRLVWMMKKQNDHEWILWKNYCTGAAWAAASSSKKVPCAEKQCTARENYLSKVQTTHKEQPKMINV